MDIKKLKIQSAELSNKNENACPFPELLNMSRGAQWERVLSKLDELGYDVVPKNVQHGLSGR
jgi:hypothetical protein